MLLHTLSILFGMLLLVLGDLHSIALFVDQVFGVDLVFDQH